MYYEPFINHHCVDDDPTEEQLEADFQALPFHMRHRKELIESITDSALGEYLKIYAQTGCNKLAAAAYNSKKLELLRLYSIIH